MKLRYLLVVLALSFFPITTQAASYDLRIPSNGLRLTNTSILTGQTVKIYATIENIGSDDIEATAICKDGSTVIGMKSLSAKYNGVAEEIWFNWTPTSAGNHEINLNIILDGNLQDETPSNNSAAISVYVDSDSDGDGLGNSVDPDDDNDGVPDTQDQFPNDPNMNKDTDHDGIDDSIDSDDDNDGLYDWDEKTKGSNPQKYDTDGDGVGDKEDAFPLNPNRSKPEPVTAPTSSGGKNQTTPAQTTSDGIQNTTGGGTVDHITGRVLGESDEAPTPTANTTSGADDLAAATALLNAANVNSSSSSPGTNVQGRILGETDEATATQAMATDTLNAPWIALNQRLPKDTVHPIQDTISFWNITNLLWGLAILFALLAFIFFFLARKRKKEQTDESNE